jgi:hypothetical protein
MWMRQDKGHRAGVAQFLARIASRAEAPIAFSDLVRTTRAALACVESAREGTVIALEDAAAARPSSEPPAAVRPR